MNYVAEGKKRGRPKGSGNQKSFKFNDILMSIPVTDDSITKVMEIIYNNYPELPPLNVVLTGKHIKSFYGRAIYRENKILLYKDGYQFRTFLHEVAHFISRPYRVNYRWKRHTKEFYETCTKLESLCISYILSLVGVNKPKEESMFLSTNS